MLTWKNEAVSYSYGCIPKCKKKTSFCNILKYYFNPSRPNPGQREIKQLKFLFSHFFAVPQKVLCRPLGPS